MIKYLIVLVMLLFSLDAVGAETVCMDTIISIESSGKADAISFRGAKYGRGLCQISEICLEDYNLRHEIEYQVTDLFNPDINRMIGDWYINTRIPAMLKYYKIQDTTMIRLWAYSAGIGNVVKRKMPAETKKYIDKYFTIMKSKILKVSR